MCNYTRHVGDKLLIGQKRKFENIVGKRVVQFYHRLKDKRIIELKVVN